MLSCRARYLPLLEVSRPPLFLSETTLDTLIQLRCSRLPCEQELGDLFTEQSPRSSSFSQVPGLYEDPALLSSASPAPVPTPLRPSGTNPPQHPEARSAFLCRHSLHSCLSFALDCSVPRTGSSRLVVGSLTHLTACLHELLRRQRAGALGLDPGSAPQRPWGLGEVPQHLWERG